MRVARLSVSLNACLRTLYASLDIITIVIVSGVLCFNEAPADVETWDEETTLIITTTNHFSRAAVIAVQHLGALHANLC